MSLIEHVARLPASELRRMRDEMRGELAVVERALALKGDDAPPRPVAPASRGDTTRRILAVLEQAHGPLMPKDVRDALNADGGPEVADNYVYSVLSRQLKRGVVARAASGGYELSSRHRWNGPTPTGTPSLVEGYGRQSVLTPTDGPG